MIKAIILLLVGFVLLVKGADVFVDGSSNIARKFGIPSIVVGLTIVAIGTSLPEAAVSISAAMKGSNAIAISNVVGSNIFNILVVLGLVSLIKTTAVSKDVLKRDFPICSILIILMTVFTMDKVFAGKVIGKINPLLPKNADKVSGKIGRIEGLVLLLIFVAFLIIAVVSALKAIKNGSITEEESDKKEVSMGMSVLFIILGAAAIKFGGDFVVDNAIIIALKLGMSETLVGLTIVAVGTSLPELVTSIVAIAKGENDIALGNVVGSNIANVGFVIGVSAIINPISCSMISMVNLILTSIVTLTIFAFAKSKNLINRFEGFVSIVGYGLFMAYSIIMAFA